MSWYNDNIQNGFIDTTQEFVGGGGGDGGGGETVDLTGINTAITNLQTELLSAQTNFNNVSDDLNDIKKVFKPKIIDNVNESFNTVIVNNTPNSIIFLQNANTTPKVKIEEGKLYLYYDYSFTNAPTISAGWTDVVNYITALKQEIILEATNIVTLDTTIFAPTVGLLPRVGVAEITIAGSAAKIIELEVLVNKLIKDQAIDDTDDGVEIFNQTQGDFDQALNTVRETANEANQNLAELTVTAATGGTGQVAKAASRLYSSKAALFSAYFANVMNTLVGAGVVVGIIGFIYDLVRSSNKEKDENKLLILYELIKDKPESNLPKFIHLNGLLIIENTNNGFSTFNTYTITLSNLAVLRIKTNGSAGLATIESVENPGGATFEVNNNIYIPKTQLGGTSGDLQIKVTSLISEVKVLGNLINKTIGDMIIIQNRRRLREKVINTDEIGDGLTVVYNSTLTNDETGEVLQVPTIKLNYNTNQFESVNGALSLKLGGDILTFSSLGYGFTTETIGGVLKVKLNLNTTHFEIIENVIYIKGYITASSLTPLNTAITTLQTNVSDLQTDVGTIETDIVGINMAITGIQGDIIGIDSAITNANSAITTLQTDLTDLQTDVATILGVNSDVVDLLDDVATLKTNVIDINGNIAMINGNINVIDLDIVDVNESLERVYKVLLPVGSTMTSDYRMNLGFKEIYSGYPYDLMMLAVRSGIYSIFNADDYNNDFLGLMPNMIRLVGTQNYRVYDTDQLAVNPSQYFTKGLIYFNKINENYITNLNNKFEFVSFLKFVSFNNNTTDYPIIQSTDGLGVISNTKLKVWIRNRKLNISHPALVSYGIYNTGTVNSITTRLLGATEYFILEPITINGTLYDDKIRITSTPMGSGFDDYKYELKMLYVPWRIGTDNINKPVGFVKIVNANDTSQPNQDSRFLQLYLSHPSTTNQPVASCLYPVVSYAVGIKNNGVVFLTPDWYIQKIVLKFDILFWETLAFPQPTLIQGIKSVMENFLEYTFRLRYSTDYINFTTVNFSVSDILGDFATTGTTINAGFLNYDPTHENIPKRFLTYTYTIPNTYPNAGGRVRFVDFTLLKKPTWNYPSGANASVPWQGQAVLHLYEFNVLEYDTTQSQTQVIANNYTTADVSNAFSTSIFSTSWYLFALQLDLPNNNIGFYLKGIYNNFTTRNNITLTSADITMPDPTITSITATFVSWANLMQQNGDLVIGNTPSVGSVNFTHFNWRFFQDLVTEFLTLTEIQKLTTLIDYGYYEQYVDVDKLLTAGEIITYNLDTPNITLNKKQLIKPMTDTIRARDLRTEQTQDPANVLIRLDNLYVEDPVASGYIFYDKITKTMTVGGGSGGGGGIGTRAEEDEIILGFIEDAAGYALQWDNVTNKLNVIPESIWQDQTPIYDEIALSRTQTSNYVDATSNYIMDYIISNTITGSLEQNIIGLDNNELIINDKSDSVKYEDIFIPLTDVNEPVLLTAERTYPPIRNFTTGNQTVSGEPYGNGTYIMSWSSSGSGGGPVYSFNTANVIGGSWGAGQYTNGLYIGSAFIVTGYLGDWLKIQLPVPIILTSIAFIMRVSTIALQDRAPRDYKIYGSNNGTNWVELISKVGAVYNTQFIHEETTSQTTAYSHYALAVNKLNIGATQLNFDEWYINGKEIITAVPEGSPITHKTFSLTHNPITLTHDFTNFNDFTSWTSFATSKGMLNAGITTYDAVLDAVNNPTGTSSLNYRLPPYYNFISVSYGNPSSANNVVVRINGIDVDFCAPSQFKTHSQSYNKYDLLTILEGTSVISANIIITLSNSSLNTYSLAVQAGTSIQINNQTAQYLSGDYIINVGETQSSVLGFNNPYPLQNSSYIDVKYSMTQKTTPTIIYKKDGFIKYVPASGTNPTTGNWEILDIDAQPLIQFGGNLPISRIDNVPPPYDDTAIYGVISTNDLNVSNYVDATSNYLKGVIDNIPPPAPYDDTAVYTAITTTSNILLTDFVARDAVLNTQITTTSNILLTDFVARDAVLKVDYMARDDIMTADSIERDDNLSASIEANKYTDAKVASYLGNYDNKIINGFVGIGTTNPLSQLEIKGQYATLRIVDSDTGTLNPKIELIRGTGLFGSDALADWRIENSQGLFTISRQLTSGNPDFLSCVSIFGNGNIGFGIDIPQARFHGHALTTSTRVATKYTDGTTTAGLGRGFDVGKDGNQNAFLENWENTAMIFTTNATERMRILNNGDVGIGTNAVPFAKLHLHKAGASQDVRIQFTDGITGATANDGVIVGKLPDGKGFLYNYENAELFFGTNGTQRMMITATGNVGIGTATTTSKLRVEGSCTINGFMTAYGTLSGGFLSVTNAGMDMLGIPVTTTTGSTYYSSIRVVFGTFTGFHRCYTSDILYNEDESDIFKNKYAGRLVVATGKIKTDYSDENNEWKSLYDKEGITYEDAVPIVELSRCKKDKRIFGVLGLPTRISNNKNRLIVNSVGEGAICVANSNGNIENGDYLQSSDLLGYAERQDDDILHNYSVAKATMDCNFELNSPYYQSYEENGVIYALIACSYHCG